MANELSNEVLEAMASNVFFAVAEGPQRTVSLEWPVNASDAEKERCTRAIQDALAAADHLGFELVPKDDAQSAVRVAREATEKE